MASTGNVFPTVGASVDRAGATAWTNPGNVVSDNTTDTTSAVPTDYLVTSGYGFSIPTDATILGVTVRVEASETGTGSSNYVAQLHSDTTPTLVGSAKSPVTVNGTTKVISTNGGPTDLWGASLTPAIVNDAGFGVSIWSTDTTNTLAIDYVTIAIQYWIPQDDNETSWWAGEKHNMAAISRSGLAAALALSTALCFGLQQQNEEITRDPLASGGATVRAPIRLQLWSSSDDALPVAQPPALDDGSHWQAPCVRGAAAWAMQPWAPASSQVDDDLPVTPPSAALDGQDWPYPSAQRAPSGQLPVWIDDEAVPHLSVDEDYQPLALPGPSKWFVYLPAGRDDDVVGAAEEPPTAAGAAALRKPIRLHLWPSDDALPIAPVPLNVEEEAWRVFTPAPVPAAPLYLPDPEQFQPAPFVAEEDGFAAPVRLSASVRICGPVWDDPVPLPQPPAFAPTDDYWFQFVDNRVSIIVVNWSVGADVSAPLEIIESDWHVYTPPRVAARPLHLPDAESIPAFSSLIVESDWQVHTQPLAPARALYLPDPEQFPPPPFAVEDDSWQVYTPPLVRARALYLPDPDAFATLIPIVESDWQVHTPPLVSARGLYLPDPEQFPPPPFAVQDDSWQVYTPPLVGARALYLPEPDAFATLIPIVEADWQVYTPPLQPARGLYLPDAEQIPAGLASPAVVAEDDVRWLFTLQPAQRLVACLPDADSHAPVPSVTSHPLASVDVTEPGGMSVAVAEPGGLGITIVEPGRMSVTITEGLG